MNFSAYRLWLVVLLLCITRGSTGADTRPFDPFVHLGSVNRDTLREAVARFYDTLGGVGNQYDKMKWADKMFAFTARIDEVAHVRSLVFRAIHANPQQPQLFNEAFHLAEKGNHFTEMKFVQYSRSLYFMEWKQFDSAMFYVLSYRDMAKDEVEGEGYRNITNILGDIYYHAGLYNQAGTIYSELLQQYEKDGNFDHYRPYVLMNNLGQIALKEHSYFEAAQWFSQSLELARKHLNASYKTNTMAYTMLKLAQTALDAGRYQEADRWLSMVDSLPNRLVHTDVQSEWRFLKGRLLLVNNQPHEALCMLTGGLSLDSLKNRGGRFFPDVYVLISQVYQQLGNYPMALEASQRYLHLTDSMKAREHLVRSMVILADRNHQISQEELEDSKRHVQLLWAIIAVVIAGLAVVSVFTRKLYKAKLELVKKALLQQEDKATRKGLPPGKTETKGDGLVDGNEQQSPEELISRLTELMETKRLYLNTGLSILDVARELSTNRTYLSKAINNHLKTNFPGFVNEYRIKEAVGLITSGYANDHTIEALAGSSGFANRNVFNSAFKKYTGVVPSFFIANYHHWDHQTASFGTMDEDE